MNKQIHIKELSESIQGFFDCLTKLIDARIDEKSKNLPPTSANPEFLSSAAEKFLTSEEVAKVLQVSLGTVKHMRQRGDVPYCRFGRLIRFRMSDIQKRLDRTLVDRHRF